MNLEKDVSPLDTLRMLLGRQTSNQQSSIYHFDNNNKLHLSLVS